MSERSERIEAAIDSEWRTTAEIIDRAGYASDPRARTCAIQRFEALCRQGYVEKRVSSSDPLSRNRAEWRLAPKGGEE